MNPFDVFQGYGTEISLLVSLAVAYLWKELLRYRKRHDAMWADFVRRKLEAGESAEELAKQVGPEVFEEARKRHRGR